MKRGRPKNEIQVEKPRKFKRIYEDEGAIEIWTYDLDKTTGGPIQVEIKYKKNNDIKPLKYAKKNKNT